MVHKRIGGFISRIRGGSAPPPPPPPPVASSVPQQSFGTPEDIPQSIPDQPQFTPIPTPRRGGGGGGGSPPQQSFGTPEDIPQSIPDQPQFTPIPSGGGGLSPQQVASARRQRTGGGQRGFSGTVEQSFDGTAERTRFFVEGRQVAESRAGEDFFRPSLSGRETATIEIERNGVTRQIQITPEELRDREFEMRKESAQNLLFGGGMSSAFSGSGGEGGEQLGGVLVRGSEIGRTGEEANQIFEVQPREPTVTERLATGVRRTGFGRTRAGINLAENLDQTQLSIERDAQLAGFERDASISDTMKTSGLPGVVRGTFGRFGAGTGEIARRGGVPQPIAEKAGVIAGDIALFGGVLGPVSATTAQIEREILSASKVSIVGVTREVGAAKARTSAVFKVERAGRLRRGFVSAESIKIAIPRIERFQIAKGVRGATSKDVQAIVSAARGREFVSGLRFPTARQVVRPRAEFVSAEIAKVTRRSVPQTQRFQIARGVRGATRKEVDLFFTRSIGITRRRGERIPFRAVGVSRRRRDVIGQLGAAETGRGFAFSRGLFRVVDRPDTRAFRIGGATPRGARINLNQITQPSQSALTSANVQAIKNVVEQSVKIQPQRQLNVLGSPTGLLTPSPRQTSRAVLRPPSIQQVIARQRILPAISQRSSVRQLSGQRTSQVVRTRQAQRQVSQQKAIQKSIQQVVQTQIPAQRQRFIARARSIPINRFTQRPPPFIPIPRITSPPRRPLIPRVKQFRTVTPRQIFPKFPVFVRRSGRFRLAGFGRTPRQAVSLGRQVTGRTLAATFKVPSFKGINVPGFRTKKEKGGVVFIEPRRRRLSTGSELKEIQAFQRRALKGGILN